MNDLLVRGSSLFICGSFTQISSVSAARVAVYAAGVMSALIPGANAGVNGPALCLASIGPWLFIGGQFTAAGISNFAVSEQNVATENITRFNLETFQFSEMTPFRLNGIGANNIVHAMHAFGDELIVGGDFSVIDGAPLVHSARYDPRFSTWTGLTPRSLPSPISSAVVSISSLGSDIFLGATGAGPSFFKYDTKEVIVTFNQGDSVHLKPGAVGTFINVPTNGQAGYAWAKV